MTDLLMRSQEEPRRANKLGTVFSAFGILWTESLAIWRQHLFVHSHDVLMSISSDKALPSSFPDTGHEKIGI